MVVGGGIAGLTAARCLSATHDVLVLEGSPRIGGKLRLATVAGVSVDVGAEAMLNRRPGGRRAGPRARPRGGAPDLGDVAASSRAGALRPMPRSLMGVPFDVDELAASGVLSAAGLARLRRRGA